MSAVSNEGGRRAPCACAHRHVCKLTTRREMRQEGEPLGLALNRNEKASYARTAGVNQLWNIHTLSGRDDFFLKNRSQLRIRSTFIALLRFR